MNRRTFERSRLDVERCANCGRREIDHVWLCDCGAEVRDGHVHIPTRGATLYCPSVSS